MPVERSDAILFGAFALLVVAILALLDGAAAAAWVQAIGSIGAILAAVWVSWKERQDTRAEQRQLERARLKRLIVALKAELRSTQLWANRWQEVSANTLAQIVAARSAGRQVDPRPITRGTMTPDATIYRQTASELGWLPLQVIESLVMLHALISDVGRMVDNAANVQEGCEASLKMLPRAKMHSAILIRQLEKFEAAGFALDAEVRLTTNEAKELAQRTGYDINAVFEERGLDNAQGKGPA